MSAMHYNTGASTKTRVAATTGDKQVVAADNRRDSVILTNDDTNSVYVSFGSDTSTATNYTILMLTNTTISIPAFDWTGEIRCISGTAGAGGLMVTVIK